MNSAPSFSLVAGGPFSRLSRRVGLWQGNAWDPVRLGLLFGLAPWLVLVLIALVEWLLSGRWPVLMRVPSVHVRLLVAVPLFFVTERSLDVRTRRCVERLEGFTGSSEDRFRRAVAWARKVSDSRWPELVLLAVVLALVALTWLGVEDLYLGGGKRARPARTALYFWYALVALPIFQFLLLRWIWRWSLWTLFLARTVRCRLRPIPSHPDRRGGLGFLSEPSAGFAWFLLACGSVVASGSAFGFREETFDLTRFGFRLAGLVTGGLLLALGPLLLFVGTLYRARFHGVRAFDELCSDLSSAFQQRWFEAGAREGILGMPDFSALADLGTASDVVRQMRIVPITRYAIWAVAGSMLAPYLVLLLAEVPLLKLLEDLSNSLLGGLL